MSLINCPECGKEISDTVKKCPNCGYSVKQSKILSLNINIKKIIIGLAALFLVFIIGVIAINLNKNPMDVAVNKCVKFTQENLLDPDSMIIYSVYAKSCLSSERGDTIFRESETTEEYEKRIDEEPDDIIEVYIHCGATNRGGGVSDSEYMYICDIKGNILDGLTKDEYEEISNDSSKLSTHVDLSYAWLDFQLSQAFGSVDGKYTDYTEQYKK